MLNAPVLNAPLLNAPLLNATSYTRPRNIINHHPKKTTQTENGQGLCRICAPRSRPCCVRCASHARPLFWCVSNAERNNDVALFKGTETPQLSPPLGPPLKATQEIPLTIWRMDLIMAHWFPWSLSGPMLVFIGLAMFVSSLNNKQLTLWLGLFLG